MYAFICFCSCHVFVFVLMFYLLLHLYLYFPLTCNKMIWKRGDKVLNVCAIFAAELPLVSAI